MSSDQQHPTLTYQQAVSTINVLDGMPAKGLTVEEILDASDVVEKLRPHAKAYQRHQMRLKHKYAETDEDGQPLTQQGPRGQASLKIDPEKQDDYDEALDNLLAREVHVPGLQKLPVEVVQKADMDMGQVAAIRGVLAA